jgi:hypothetical protein
MIAKALGLSNGTIGTHIRTAGACFGIRCHLPLSMPCSATFATTGG